MAGGSSGVATGAGTKVDVTLKLPQLQNLCKRDPKGYREDYDIQVRRLESECGILKLSPQTPSPRLIELIQFAAAVSSSSYKGVESDRIANIYIELLVGGTETKSETSKANVHMTMPTSALQLHRDVRKSCVSALILMRNKGVLEPLKLLELFFRLLAVVPDKGLREQLYKHMVNDIRNINKKGKKDEKVNRAIQSFLHRVVNTHGEESTGEAATDVAAKRATDMVCELYRRQVWTDDRTVAILASAIESRSITVMSRAMRFFLNIEEKMADDKKQEDDFIWDASQKVDRHLFSRKTKTRRRQTERQLKNRKKEQKKRETGPDEWLDIRDDDGVEEARKLYPAIELLRDPHGLAESVFKRLKKPKSIPYRNKLLMMNFLTRLVGNHELLLLSLYPFLQKYMGGHQRDVTAILAYTVQGCHESVPPEEIYGILKTIAHNFITERCSEEQMAVGINAVRAVCARVPSVLSLEESKESAGSAAFDVEAFTRDIAAYSNHRDRSVSIAGKTFTNFIRVTYPTLLQGKNRGLKGSALHKAKTKPLRYGETKVSTGVEGADLLVEYEAKKAAYQTKEQETADASDPEDNNEEDELDMNSDNDDDAPDLVVVQKPENGQKEDEVLDLSKMTSEEREKLKQDVSSTRIFSTSDFMKMRKLVEREERLKSDPREAARRKRAIARGQDFEELSDDSSDGSDDEAINIKGAVNPYDIMAEAKRKRKTKAEKLEKILAGRDKFETKERPGGSTNTEKERRKNFLMSKSSRGARSKGRGKGGLSEKRGNSSTKAKTQTGHEAKKRRRKM
jgi:protein SDA1